MSEPARAIPSDAPMWPLRGPGDRPTLGAVLVGIAVLLAVVGALLGPATSTETRYAQMGREMLDSGDWIVPRLNGAPLVEKPPFEYWVNAACFAVFGASDLTARFPSLLAGALTLLVLARAAKRFAPERDLEPDRRARAPFAVLALATMPGFCIQALTISTDIWLVLTTTIAGVAWLESVRTDGRPGLRTTLALHAAFGVGMLVKGPLTLVLTGLAAIAVAIARRDARPLKPFVHPLGLLLFVGITLPWYLAMEHRLPGLLHDLVSRRLFGNMSSAKDSHAHGVWIVWLPLLGAFPWLGAVPALVVRGLRGGAWRRGPLLPALCLAFAAPLLFTFSKARLVSYASPAFPWIAFLVATHWPSPSTRTDDNRILRREVARATIGAALFALGFVVSTVVKGGDRTTTVVAGGCALLALVIALGVGLSGRTASLYVRVAGVALALLATIGACALAAPERLPAARPLWESIAKVRAPGEELGAALDYEADWGLLPWFANEPVRYFGYPSAKMIVAPEKFAPDRFLAKAALDDWFRAPARRFLLTRRRDLDRRGQVGGAPTHRVAAFGYYVVVTNLPLPGGG